MTQSTYRPLPSRCPECSSTKPGIHRAGCTVVQPLVFPELIEVAREAK